MERFICPICKQETGVIGLDSQHLQEDNKLLCTNRQCGWTCLMKDIPTKTGCKNLADFLKK